ncbi:AAA family ATPase [Paucibacter sp. XJ19-41]|uniref:AAA family ATPase n=1 Tax=Paucibacter sp. XJ19-41 TaxID=2927824 RepID=UPI00234AA86B|nr:AAA family ATPase [Paucibacter sp. XJ19-41]MDC6167282.1 AAA family ATPase [Paucibacter sp. XJ19-41]
MLIRTITINSFRGLGLAKFRLQPGFNLLVGINGAGKTSLLEAMRILLAKAVQETTPASPFRDIAIKPEDITVGRDFSVVEMEFSIHGTDFQLTMSEQREQLRDASAGGLKDIRDVEELPSLRRGERPEAGDVRLEGTLRGQTSERPEVGARLFPEPDKKFKARRPLPLVLFLSVRRAIATHRVPKATAKVPAYEAAFDAERGLAISGLAEWWRGREALIADAEAQGDPSERYAQQLDAVRSALATLLPEVQDWRVDGKDMRVTRTVKVSRINDRGEEQLVDEARDIPVGWLSDGERSLAAIGADIAIRLATLNEGEKDPVKQGDGVVLLDEIDLHLHPQWQRRIAADLPAAFPQLQFIATSHSPQVIGETPAGRAILLHEGGKTEVLDESLGRDSGWILRHVMDTPERNVRLQAGLDDIDRLMESGELREARKQVTALRAEFGDDKELIGANAAIDRWEILGDETDSEGQ